MVSQKVVIKNPTGLHLRPAGILCKEAMQFKSLITFSFRENMANAKSVLSVLGACVKCGDEIEFTCDGEDEEEALKTLVAAIENGLGVKLVDEPQNHVYPMPLDTSDIDTVYVGRIRRDLTEKNGLTLWCCGDQVRKGAATNAVQIAELLIEK